MKYSGIVMTAMASILFSIPAMADGEQSQMPMNPQMMQGMNPQMMQGMMGNRQRMPMMGGQQWGDPMGYQQQIPYGVMGNRHGSMMNPQLMQQMMASREDHMKRMEGHLAGIDTSLKELVELQRSR